MVVMLSSDANIKAAAMTPSKSETRNRDLATVWLQSETKTAAQRRGSLASSIVRKAAAMLRDPKSKAAAVLSINAAVSPLGERLWSPDCQASQG
jgi:hypothetical protein